MARTANTEPKQDTYLLIGGEQIGFKTQKHMIQFCALSAFNPQTTYHSHDGYKVEDNAALVDFEKDAAQEQCFPLADKIANNGFKCDFRLGDVLVVRFATRLKQLHYLMAVSHDISYWGKWKRFGGEQIAEPNIVNWDEMTQEQKIEFFSSL